MQNEIAKLKQHSHLCEQISNSNYRNYNKHFNGKPLKNEIKDLLYDLREEHNYISE